MAVKLQPQPSLPLGLAPPNVSLPAPTQAEVIAALADLMVQLWEMNEPIDTPSEEKIDE